MTASLSDRQADSIVDALDDERQVHIWDGAVRSGKTMSVNLAWCEYARTAPPGPLLMVGKTKDTLQRNVLDPINSMFGSASPLEHTPLSNSGRLFGRQVYMVGANDRKAESRIRGLTLAGTMVDELTLLPDKSYWSMLRTRHLTVPGAKIFATTNPDSPAHWVKTEILDQLETADARRYHFTLDDNPIIPAAERARLERSMTGLFYKRFIQGLWVAAEGAIYDMLDEDRHTAAAPAEVGQCWLGIDYGTSNATHAVLLAYDYRQQRMHAVAEWRHDGRAQRSLTDAELSAQLQTWVNGLKLTHDGITPVLDPSAASMRVQMRTDGWHTTAADNRVLDGIRSVSNLLAQNLLVIDPDTCPHLWRELQGYVWDPKAQSEGEDRPVKQNDHGADALRYACMAAWPAWRTLTGLPRTP